MKVTYETFQHAGNVRTEGIAIFGHEIVNVFMKPRYHLLPNLETQEFIYYQNNLEKTYTISNAMSITLQIILQNRPDLMGKLEISEIVNKTTEKNSSLFNNANLKHSFCFGIVYRLVHSNQLSEKCDILILNESNLVELNGTQITDYLNKNGFFIYNGLFSKIVKNNLEVIFQCHTEIGEIILLRPQRVVKNYTAMEFQIDDLTWLDEVRSSRDKNILLFSYNQEISGILGLTQCLLKENNNIRSLRIDDEETRFDLNEEFYKKQLRKDLTINVLKNRKWGTYLHLPMEYIESRAVSQASVSIKTVGDLSSLIWQEVPKISWYVLTLFSVY